MSHSLEAIILENVSKEFNLHPELDIRQIKSALIYQCLSNYYTHEAITLDEVLSKHPGIGLIGPGNGILTHILEACFNKFKIFCTHAILHDAYGRFYTDKGKGPGYCYGILSSKIPHFARGSPILGHLSGLIHCIYKRYSF